MFRINSPAYYVCLFAIYGLIILQNYRVLLLKDFLAGEDEEALGGGAAEEVYRLG